MDKFLLVIFFLLKIIIIIIAPIFIFLYKKDEKVRKTVINVEIVLLILLAVLYLIGFPYVVDSKISNMFKLGLLSESKDGYLSDYLNEIDNTNLIKKMEPDNKYKTHKNDDIYYYNGFEQPLSVKKVSCEGGYDYYKNYSSIITTTSMLLSSYFNKTIDPIEVYNKAVSYKLFNCNTPLNKDKFFEMISIEYKVNFIIINNSQLQNYILNGKPVMIETIGNGMLSCKESYYLIYDVNNIGEYLMLDPNNKSYEYICPDGTTGFGNVLKANYNEETFTSSDILSDTNRLIVIGGTR